MWRLSLVALVGILASSCQSDATVTAPTTAAIAFPSSSSTVSTTAPDLPAPDLPTPDVASFDSAAGIAAVLNAAERGIRDRGLSPDETARWGRVQQRAYRALTNHAEWDAAVRDRIGSDVQIAFDRNVEARRAVADHASTKPAGEPSVTLPAWTIVDPLPAPQLLGYYREAESATGVPWQYLAAINVVETRVGRIVGASSSGAVGPMQFLPSTWSSCCVGDVQDPHDSILGAATYLVSRGAPIDMIAALRGYNPNDGYVGAVDAYARNMIADERAFFGYHAWEVYVSTSAGSVRLPVGYSSPEPADAVAYVATHPQDLAPVND